MAFQGFEILIRDKENREKCQISFLVDEKPLKPLKMLWIVKSASQQGRLAWNFKRQLLVFRILRVFTD